jgi:hypothetical protein
MNLHSNGFSKFTELIFHQMILLLRFSIIFLVFFSFFAKGQDDFFGKVIASKGTQIKVLGKNGIKIKFQVTDTFLVFRDTASVSYKVVNKTEQWQEIALAVGISTTLNESEFRLLKLQNGKTTETGKAIRAERLISLGKFIRFVKKEN